MPSKMVGHHLRSMSAGWTMQQVPTPLLHAPCKAPLGEGTFFSQEIQATSPVAAPAINCIKLAEGSSNGDHRQDQLQLAGFRQLSKPELPPAIAQHSPWKLPHFCQSSTSSA